MKTILLFIPMLVLNLSLRAGEPAEILLWPAGALESEGRLRQ